MAGAASTDPRAIRAGQRKQRELERERLTDLATALGSYSGRRMFWTFLSRCGVFGSIWDPSARIHYNAGKQDVGHALMADLSRANPPAFEQMQREAHARAVRAAVQADAAPPDPVDTLGAAITDDAPDAEESEP